MNKILKMVSIVGLLLLIVNSCFGLAIEEPETTPKIIHPGDDVDIWFKLNNNEVIGDNERVEDVYVEITPSYPFELLQVNPSKGKITYNYLEDGVSKDLHFKFHVDDDARSNEYKMDVNVKYYVVRYENGEEEYKYSRSVSRSFYITIYGDANFELSSDGDVLIPSETTQIPVIIANKGTGVAKQVSFSVGNTESVNPVDTTKFYIGSISPSESTKTYISLHTDEKATEGSYSVPITIDWIDQEGLTKQDTINLGMIVKGDLIIGLSNIITEPKEIKPKDTYVRIDASVSNNGHGEAKDINLELIANYPFRDSWSSSNIKNIGTLTSGESKSITFYIDVDKDAEATHYEIPINVSYLDIFNKKHYEIEYIDIYVKPKPILELETDEITIENKDGNQVLLKIKNVGNEKAENVKITAVKNTAQPFDYPTKTDTIGTLKINDSGEGLLVIDVDNGVEKQYIINLEVRAVGDSDMGDDKVYISTVPLKVNVIGGHSELKIIGVVIIIIIALIAGYVLLKKRKIKIE
ncbi:COG1361 S-layer family protein [Methanococcus voltae]|uniref:S-layer domain-like protein n=1 Tax=Methanococcus voltae (strain ATCC BAA-1334 / A3) TaxID=456320 RepID=D7DUX4_METV3|nr:COG1361 S-layer family protein [Methanococcus voltae]MCS3900738.1 hypothetical protein [Methanococcus voltae]